MKYYEDLDIVIPYSIEMDWLTVDQIVDDILAEHARTGFDHYALACPCGGWRSVGFPEKEIWEQLAHRFVLVRDALAAHGIRCGWWVTITLKSGQNENFTRLTDTDGEESLFANCPLDAHFRTHYAEMVALFAKIARPEFILTEDDYSIHAGVPGKIGCCCKWHMTEWNRRTGRNDTQKGLEALFLRENEEAYALQAQWRNLMRDTMVQMSDAIRTALDRETPEIPVGLSEPGYSFFDGNTTAPVCRALAGEHHLPFARLNGASYSHLDSKELPRIMFNALYHAQHCEQSFSYYHEVDCFPHTRFFLSGKQMMLFFATAVSYGACGALFHSHQLADGHGEERTYVDTLAKYIPRFDAAHKVIRQCERTGINLDFSPERNYLYTTRGWGMPFWTRTLALMGFPATTLPASISFWDDRSAQYTEKQAVLQALGGNLFLDGDAARILCERGFGRYLGVTFGQEVAPASSMLRLDLGAREVIRPAFWQQGRGKTMPSPHMYSPIGNGVLRRITVEDERVEVITDLCDFQGNVICPAMVRFENELGGKIVIYGTSLANGRNNSQNLYNYRRKYLFEEMIKWCDDSYVFLRESASTFLIVNEAKDKEHADFYGILTLINLGEDDLSPIKIHLPPAWKGRKLKLLSDDATWCDFPYRKTEDGIEIDLTLPYAYPMYLLAK